MRIPCLSIRCWCLPLAETMYSCVMLALKLLKAFCPESGPEQVDQTRPGWPSPVVLKALQVSLHHNALLS